MNRALVAYENAKQDVGIERARIESAEKDLRGEMDLLMEQDRADAEREIASIRADFLRYRGEREGQAYADHDRLVSEGEAALDRANAYRTQKFAEVYRTPGGRLYLASIAAANLQIEDVVLNSNDPEVPSILDLDELIGLLVGGGSE
jgi:regulator of protease activity HflC (stomatin/prohibitin superfamily)